MRWATEEENTIMALGSLTEVGCRDEDESLAMTAVGILPIPAPYYVSQT